MNAHSPAVYIAVTVAAACGFALAAVLQRQEAVKAPEDAAMKPTLLLQLMRSPLWLLGIVIYIVAYVLQIVAVSLGPVVIVQPLISVQLVFALIFGVWLGHQPAGWRDWLGAVAVVAGIAAFIVGTNPQAGDPHASALPWLVASGIVVLCTAVVILAGRKVKGPPRSALWGTAAGFMWGLMIVLMKTVTADFTGSESLWSQLIHLFEGPYLYGLVVSALAGFVFLQSAFQAGSLTNALVTYTVVEIVVAVILGIVLFGEKPHDTLAGHVLVAVSSVVMLGGIILLARSPAVKAQM